MAFSLLELQLAVKNALTAGSPPAFSYPVHTGKAPANATFPYAVIGDGDTSLPWKTKLEYGEEILFNVDTWSRSSPTSMVQIKQMMGQVLAALDEAELSVSGFGLVSCDVDYQQPQMDADGVTWHGIQRFRVFLSAA
ncbi:MAG: DUF3168 domain-containing protein [Alphaproteobacteria bacterium]|nr:DUF3168 domain-containing protein [Alphaproteobacteria bacterium]